MARNAKLSTGLALFGLLSIFALLGCSSMKEEILPLHDEVLIFELPYDLTYLRTLEALENVSGWELDVTEKEKGIISVRNINFSNLTDADKRQATFLVKRKDRYSTSVALAPDSQRVIGGDDLMKQVNQYLSREL